MTDRTAWQRMQMIVNMINELKARITALEARVRALEESQAQRWFQ